MFDQRTQLQERLRPVVRTLRGVRFWWITAAVLLLATIATVLIIGPVRDGRLETQSVVIAIVSVVAVGIAMAALVSAVSYRNPRDIATRLERRFPTLQQRLLTAIELMRNTDGQPLGYLQRRVIEEAHAHSKTHRWTEVVPPSQVMVSRMAGLVALAAMVGTLAFLAAGGPIEDPNSLGVASSMGNFAKVQVEPGNTEIERGTSLIVTARFENAADLEAAVELICIAEDGSERRYTMRQTLDDPIVSAFVPSIDASMRYQVVSPTLQSEIYQADVFDFPSLVRADAELEFPQYTSMLKKRIEDTLRVSMVEGTKLSWELNLNKPVGEAMLVSDTKEQIALVAQADNPLRYRAEFQMSESRRWRLELVDDAGRQNKFPPELIARVFANEPPTVKMLVGGDAEASPLEEFPIAVSVKDDFEVVRFGVSYGFPGDASQEIILGESVPKGETRRGDHLFDFEALNAKADQLLTYYLWAEDKDRDGKVRRNQGDLHFIEIRPFEEIFRENQSASAGASEQQQQQSGENGQKAEELAELQKQIINATWKVIRRELGDQRSQAFVGDVGTIAQSQSDAFNQLQELAADVSDDQSQALVKVASDSMQTSVLRLEKAGADGETQSLDEAVAAQQAAYQALLGLRAREFQVSRSQRSQQQRSSSASQQRRQQQLNELELKNDENRYETQSQAQAEQAQAEASAQREVIDRLRELAQRQEDINKQVAQLQSALELAQTEAEREEALRQLKRLRDQEQELLRDADELGQRMQEQQQQQQSQAADSQALQQAAEQLEQTRENLRQATEALQRNDASQALAAGTRAERELDETRERLREEASGNFNEAMRQIRSDARELDERQQEIASQIAETDKPAAPEGPGLRPETEKPDLVGELQQQRERLDDLLKQVEQTVQQAESTEPLLAQNLYDTYRTTQQQKVDNKLNDTAELLRRGLQRQAEGVQAEAAEAISQFRQRLDKAADSVLGDQTKALERALGELDRLQQQLDGEIEEATGRGGAAQQPQESETPSDARPGQQPGQPGQPGQEPQPGQQPGEQPSTGEQQPGGEQPGGQQPGGEQPGGEQPGGQQPGGDQPGGDQPGGQQPGGQQPGGQQPGSNQPGGQPSERAGGMIERIGQPTAGGADQGGRGMGGGPRQPAPITGEGFREWSDRLRDVEQMVEDPALRAEATRIRERAREVRGEMKRHSQPPQWDEVEEMIAKPLRELKTNVAQELLRRSADRHAIVPIDRDPVPDRYGEAVRRYYENLGSGQ